MEKGNRRTTRQADSLRREKRDEEIHGLLKDRIKAAANKALATEGLAPEEVAELQKLANPDDSDIGLIRWGFELLSKPRKERRLADDPTIRRRRSRNR